MDSWPILARWPCSFPWGWSLNLSFELLNFEIPFSPSFAFRYEPPNRVSLMSTRVGGSYRNAALPSALRGTAKGDFKIQGGSIAFPLEEPGMGRECANALADWGAWAGLAGRPPARSANALAVWVPGPGVDKAASGLDLLTR